MRVELISSALVLLLGCFPVKNELYTETATGTGEATEASEPTGNPMTAPVTTGPDMPGTGDVAATEGGGDVTGPIAVCGNGQLEEGEDCEGADLGGETCTSLEFEPGTLSCTRDCTFDLSGCAPEGMVAIPGGVFEMGSTTGIATGKTSELPVRQVQVDSFYIDRTEVTVADYRACVDNAGPCGHPGSTADCNWNKMDRAKHPVNCVEWSDAETYCNWVEKRLPTEAEWEKAARGTNALTYPWGDAPEPSCDRVVMSDGCGASSTMEVGSKPMGSSPYGVQDMAGNVDEWVADFSGRYDPRDLDNPTGPPDGTSHVYRGGQWTFGDAFFFRTTTRQITSVFLSGKGFRCAKTPSGAQ